MGTALYSTILVLHRSQLLQEIKLLPWLDGLPPPPGASHPYYFSAVSLLCLLAIENVGEACPNGKPSNALWAMAREPIDRLGRRRFASINTEYSIVFEF